MQKKIESAYQTALKKKDVDMAIASFVICPKTAELVNSGAYEAAAVAAMPSSDVWPRRARSMKIGMLASLVMVKPIRNWRYSPRQ